MHGDAWVGRIFDNEDDFRRLDFGLADLSSSAAWVAKAAQQMRDKARGEAPAAVLQRMEAERKAQAGKAAPPKATVKELTATEAAKVCDPALPATAAVYNTPDWRTINTYNITLGDSWTNRSNPPC